MLVSVPDASCTIDPKLLNSSQYPQTTPVGFEPRRGDPIGLAGRRLNHSAKVSSDLGHIILPDIFAGRPSMLWLSEALALAGHRGSVLRHPSLFRLSTRSFLGLQVGRLCVFDSTRLCVVSHGSCKECRGMPTLDLECLALSVACNA